LAGCLMASRTSGLRSHSIATSRSPPASR
jgi:hypothetical protein